MKPIALILMVLSAAILHATGLAELRTLSALFIGMSIGMLYASLPDDLPWWPRSVVKR